MSVRTDDTHRSLSYFFSFSFLFMLTALTVFLSPLPSSPPATAAERVPSTLTPRRSFATVPEDQQASGETTEESHGRRPSEARAGEPSASADEGAKRSNRARRCGAWEEREERNWVKRCESLEVDDS